MVSFFFNNPKILDIYGGYGLMYKMLWKNYDYLASDGDSFEWIDNYSQNFNFDICDIDLYSSPYEMLSKIANKNIINKKIGFICTDGCLKRQAHMRGNIPKFLCELMNWKRYDVKLMANIYYNYPSYVKGIIINIFKDWKIEKFAVQYGKGFGKSLTCYFAFVLER